MFISNDPLISAFVDQQLVLIGFFAIWCFISALKLFKTRPFLKLPTAISSHLTIFDTLWGFAFYLVPQLFIVPALYIYFSPPQSGALSMSEKSVLVFCSSLSGLIFLLYYYWLCLTQDKKNGVVGYSSLPWYKNFWDGLGYLFYATPFVYLWSSLIQVIVVWMTQKLPETQYVVKQFLMIRDNPYLLIGYGFLIVVVAPLSEELLFRGLLQNWCKRLFQSIPLAIVVSSAVFAFFHFTSDQGYSNIDLLSSLFIFSCFLGYLYESHRSIWVNVGLHSAFNSLSVLMLLATGEP